MAKRRKRVEPEPGFSTPDRDTGLNNILQAAVSLGQQLEIFRIPYCVIGGVAVQRWGEPRQTVDVDATLLIGFGCEESAIEHLLSQFNSRIDKHQAPVFYLRFHPMPNAQSPPLALGVRR